ncbi:MAG: prolipoprotein diacylglyceryl transferase [Spirochaetaceae bacterium]|nr:MAG: prolipoprotein diacylglyceryl transferase [Spirochaetaceae bacterium]
MHPYLFEDLFGPVFFLRSYVLLLLAAAVTVYLLVSGPALRMYRAKVGVADGAWSVGAVLDRGCVRELSAVTALFLLIGARAGYVILHRNLYLPDPSRILRVWEGGLVFHGGLAGAVFGVFLFARVRRIPLMHILDMALPYVPVGYAIGRVGCFLNGCCGGILSDNPWGIAWPRGLFSRHPTQLYAALAGVAMTLVLVPMYRRSQRAGTTTASFLAVMGAYRFLLEYLRLHRPVEGGLSPFQVTSLVLLVAAAAVAAATVFRRPSYRSALLLVLPLLLVLQPHSLSAGEPPPVKLIWGVPEHVEMGLFTGLQREPQAQEFTLHGDGRQEREELSVVWRRRESYIVPLFASSEHTLKGVRYYGYDIPEHVDLEWLDPWNRVWYALEEIPADIIRLQVFHSAGEETRAIDFGPPEGAEFHPQLSRFIWFRVTPRRAGTFTLRIFGYHMEHDDPGRLGFPDPEEVSAASNTLLLRARVYTGGGARPEAETLLD